VRLLVCCAAALVATPAAWAGGVPVELAAVGSTIWSVSDSGLVAVDARSGAVVARPLTPFSYPIALAASGRTLWVASVPNGFGSGAVTWIRGPGRRATPLLLRRQGVFDVCAGGDVAWAVVGARRRRVARIGASGRVRFVGLGSNPAWCGADAAAAWVSTEDGRLVRIDARTSRVRTVARSPGPGQVAVGRRLVWALVPGGVVGVDRRSGRARRISFPVTPFSVAAGRRGAWVLSGAARTSTRLSLLDRRTGRIRASRRLAGAIDSVLEAGSSLWVGGVDRRRHDTMLLRLDPRTLAVRRVVRIL
jgi:hypothetical protein